MSNESDIRIFGLSPRGARWVLGASLAINFLIIGLAGGAAWKMQGFAGGFSSFRFSHELIEAAGSDRRDAVREVLRKGRGEGWRAEMRAEVEALPDIIARTPFDPEALRAAFNESSDRRNASRLARNEATIEAISLLTDAERASFAQELRERLKRYKKKKD